MLRKSFGNGSYLAVRNCTANNMLSIVAAKDMLSIVAVKDMLPFVAWLAMPPGGTLSVTDGEVPPKSLCLQAIPEFLLKMDTRFRNFFSF